MFKNESLQALVGKGKSQPSMTRSDRETAGLDSSFIHNEYILHLNHSILNMSLPLFSSLVIFYRWVLSVSSKTNHQPECFKTKNSWRRWVLIWKTLAETQWMITLSLNEVNSSSLFETFEVYETKRREAKPLKTQIHFEKSVHQLKQYSPPCPRLPKTHQNTIGHSLSPSKERNDSMITTKWRSNWKARRVELPLMNTSDFWMGQNTHSCSCCGFKSMRDRSNTMTVLNLSRG